MSNFTTLRGTPTYTPGKFGNAFTGTGTSALVSSTPISATVGTLEAWVKTSDATAVRVAVGNDANGGGLWIGNNAAGKAACGVPGGLKQTAITISDGAWHHLALVTGSGVQNGFYVDGVLADSTFAAVPFTFGATGATGIGGYGSSTGNDWNGQVDEVRFSNIARYTSAFTPPTAAFTDDANTLALFHLEADGTDSHGAAAAVPNQVTGLVATPSSGQVALSWAAPSNGGSTITDYVVQYRTPAGSGGFATFPDGVGTTTSATVTGLTNGTAYGFVVSAVNAIGTGAASSEVTSTPAAAAAAPAQVTGLTATPGVSQVALSWTAPANNGAAITDYVVKYRTPAGSGTFVTFADGTSAATTTTVTGLTGGTAYGFTVAAINSAGTGTASSEATATPTAPDAVFAPNDPNIMFSPYNWLVGSTVAETINPGAYFRTQITGSATAITLNFDTTGLTAPLPQLKYRVDQGGWQVATIAATVPLAMPTGNTWGVHNIEVVVKSTASGANRWSPRQASVKLTGITTNGTATRSPISRNGRLLIYGDSITEGTRTLNSNATNDTDRDDSTMGWAYRLGDEVGAEVGVIGFGATGLSKGGNGGVPSLPTSYNLLWSGQSRSFSPAPTAIVINIGTNDGATDTVAAMIGLLNNLLTACPTTPILVLRPFNGTQASNLVAAIAGCSSPSRVTYVDTTGWWSSADASDGLHPYGYVNVAELAPRVAAKVKTATSGGASKRFINVGGNAVPVSTVIKG